MSEYFSLTKSSSVTGEMQEWKSCLTLFKDFYPSQAGLFRRACVRKFLISYCLSPQPIYLDKFVVRIMTSYSLSDLAKLSDNSIIDAHFSGVRLICYPSH